MRFTEFSSLQRVQYVISFSQFDTPLDFAKQGYSDLVLWFIARSAKTREGLISKVIKKTKIMV